MDRIAVIIPCYNEAATIAKVVTDFRHALPEATVYVYDNNSTDNSAALAAEAGATVCHEPLQGKGNVIRRMFREVDAQCYLMVDADDTYPADAARAMVQAVADGADMVVGDRLSSTYFEQNHRPMHGSGNRLVRFLIRHLYHTNIHDIMTGYRAFSRRFVKLFPVMSLGFEIETEMTLHALDRRFVLAEIPITYRDRPEGSTSKLNTVSDGLKVLRTIFILFKDYKPLGFYGWLALLLALLGVVLLVPVVLEYFATGLVPRFPTLILALVLLLGAMQSLFTGLCLDTIAGRERRNYELRLVEYEERQRQA
ncbi:MAG: glycosyltransferase [Bacteroidales bacterium]|nr:glycosyltransferase [Bacteroidales bacterium]